MHDLALSEELDRVTDVGIVDQAQDVVVGDTRLLLGREVLVEVGNHVSLHTDIFHVIRHSAGGNGIHARGVIHEIGCKRALGDLVLGKVARELMDDCRYQSEVWPRSPGET